MNLSFLFPRYFLLASSIAALSLIGIAGIATAGDVEALYRAAGDGERTEVAALLKSGVNPNSRTRSGSFALNAAAAENDVGVIQVLIDHNADPNVQNSEGDTPLICATKYAGGKSATVEVLVKAGSDLGIRDNDGRTALDYAKANSQREAIAILESAGS